METIALLLSLIAIVFAGVAYARTGGLEDVRKQLAGLGSKSDGARDVAANAIDKIESAVRGHRGEDEESAEGSPDEKREDR